MTADNHVAWESLDGLSLETNNVPIAYLELVEIMNVGFGNANG